MKTFALALSSVTLTACVHTTEVTQMADTPGAYMIVAGKNYEAKDLAPYAASLPPIYAKYGGKYVAFSTDYAVMEGSPEAQAVIISAWPNAAAAKSFWLSPEYREAIKLRDDIGEFDVIILPALPAQK